MSRLTTNYTIEAIEVFCQKFRIDESGCWLWRGKVNKYTGYSNFWYKGGSGGGHRWLKQAFIGRVLNRNEYCDHLCQNKGCVNPVHIEVVTNRENISRYWRQRAKCSRGHKRTEENTYFYKEKNGTLSRRCKPCRRMRLFNWRLQNRLLGGGDE